MDAFGDLLIEIGTEELPPKALQTLSAAFLEGFRAQLATQGIRYDAIEAFAAPRRLALLTRGIATRQPDRELTRRGPALSAAFSADGAPTPAALGFARSCGVNIESLEREETDKGTWLSFRGRQPGAATAGLVPAMTEAALAALPIPKRMRWGDREEEFVRPVQWVCLLLNELPIPGSVLGVPASRETRGHRFHHPAPIPLVRAADYAETLRAVGHVEADFAQRRDLIRVQVESVAAAHGLRARLDDDLLDEVTALTEWPRALLGRFDPVFLDIPPEVLIETMRSHQKYFPVEDAQGRLQACFVTVANLESRDPEQVRAGNERVIRPRFADAAFFWSQDLAQPLEAFHGRLERVVFQERLGTLADKTARIGRLAAVLAPALAGDPALIARAARLARCDLATAMVYEFPGLQGTMGRYYAERSGEAPEVCAALEEQYLPRFAGDRLPTAACGRALALADRLDTLTGIFGIGQRPTGARDPYGLRRASIAALRLLIETPLDLDLRPLLATAAAGFAPGTLAEGTAEAVLGYMLERLRAYYEERGVPADTVDAVLALAGGEGLANPWDLDRRIAAVTAFRALPAAAALAAANKRIRNLLTKASAADLGAGPDGEPAPVATAPRAGAEPAERRLAERVADLTAGISPLAERREYVEILTRLADLREDVDAFFDGVMVMAEDPATRRDRLRLLRALEALFLRVADLARLQ